MALDWEYLLGNQGGLEWLLMSLEFGFALERPRRSGSAACGAAASTPP